MTTSFMAFFFLLAYTVIASQCQEFSELNATLKSGMVNFCVGIYESKLTALYNEYNICSWTTTPIINPNTLHWIYNGDIKAPFNANSISYFGQVCIQHKHLLYGVPYYKNKTYDGIYYFNRLFIFDLQQNQYKSSGSYQNTLLIPTNASCLIVAGNELYIIGGRTNNYKQQILGVVQSYNIATDQFVVKDSSLNTPRMGHGCSINTDTQNSDIAGYIYIFGGHGKYYNLLTSIEKYDIHNNKWKLLNNAALSVARELHSCSYINPYIYCVGGTSFKFWDQKYYYLASVEIFDVINEKMLKDDTLYMNIARTCHSAILYRNYFLIFGGRYNNDETDGVTKSIEELIFDEPTINPTSDPTSDPIMNDNEDRGESNVGLIIIILCLIMSAMILIIYLCYHRRNKVLKRALLEIEGEYKRNEEYIPYFEKQKWEFCLVHSLNALFQERKFEIKDLNEICKILAPNKLINPHKSLLQTGNYDANVLMMALENNNVSVQWFDSRKCEKNLDLFNEEFLSPQKKKEFIGFILNNKHKKMYIFNRRHWLTIKRINNIWYNLDSRLQEPIKYETISEIKKLQNWLINACKNNDAQLMICRLKLI